MKNSMNCHFCAQALPDLSSKWDHLPRVTSDCRPANWRGDIVVCPSCGLAQTMITEGWRAAAKGTYDSYDIYAASNGAEQTVRSSVASGMQARSNVLVEHISQLKTIAPSGKLLDIGCGNGAFLQAFGSRFPEWKLSGSEVHRHYEARLKELPNFLGLYNAEEDGLPEECDIISLIHVLEHIDSPDTILRSLKQKAAKGGALLVQVPAWRSNPFALMISDHSSHFIPESLAMVANAAGWSVVSVKEGWIPKEISLIARNNVDSTAERDHPINSDKEQKALDAALLWLDQVLKESNEIASKAKKFGLFGSAIAATFLYQGAPDKVSFFVDEDKGRIGRTHLGLPILSPDQVESDADVFVGISPVVSQHLISRLLSCPGRFHSVSTSYKIV